MNKKLIVTLLIALMVSLTLLLMWIVLFDNTMSAPGIGTSQFEGMSQEEISVQINKISTTVSISERIKSVSDVIVSNVPGYLKAIFIIYIVLLLGIYFLLRIRGQS